MSPGRRRRHARQGRTRSVGYCNATRRTLALAVLALTALGWVPRMPSVGPDRIQLARESDDREDRDFGPAPRTQRLPGMRVGQGMKTAPGGYDAQRVKRFWRHYHGARAAAKERPLERQK